MPAAGPSPATLNDRFAIPGLLFEAGAGGLTRAVIDTPVAGGEVYLHGAHVAAWRPAGHKPVLWMSTRSQFELGKPIRGGVPICFPWFGAHPVEPSAPAHGLARTHFWNVEAVSRLDDGGVGVELRAAIGRYRLSYGIRFSHELEMTLTIERNLSATPVRFEAALHTYFTVGDVRKIRIEGLEKTGFIDKVDNLQRKGPTGQAITITGETDRVYCGTRQACRLVDPVLGRAISIRKAGSDTTVVWNPWIEKSARMADFGDEEWTGMVCIETANAADHAVDLQPGQVSCMKAVIGVERL